MKLLITGGAGFIGSNLINYWVSKYPTDEIINVDKLTYAADLKYLEDIQNLPTYTFVKADLANRSEVRNIVNQFHPDGVIHLAAESHVDNSINGPEIFVITNVVGTFNLLDECRQLWQKDDANKGNHQRFLHVSTDEVFGTLGEEGFFTEETAYSPNSPYSATKACSDHLVKSYYHTYGMNIIVTNCSNNFGPHQHKEKLIPTVIRKAINHEPIPVYGNGQNVRDWLYVEDHCRALDVVFHHGRIGESYNIGSKNEWKNIDLVKLICNILNELVGKGPEGDYKKLITFVKDRPGHDYRYSINPAKIERELSWKASSDFISNMNSTIKWYLKERQ